MNEQMNIVIVGHVDHGKSTIIGRLLADTDTLPMGKLQQVRDLCERTSKPFEYAFLLDALKDEQAQGITIDSARVFFKSSKRHYIIIDAPGHIEFLKNMITGASRADAALLVIDAGEGVQENSRRHGYMLGMLGIRKVAVLVNKMDLVGFSREAFEAIRDEYSAFLREIDLVPDTFIPVSGFHGDNIAMSSEKMPWWSGETVLETLDGFRAAENSNHLPFRLPVQDVYKFTRFGDSRRIIAGTIATGVLNVGDRVVFYPSGKSSVVKTLETFPPVGDPPAREAAGNAIGFTLAEQLYVTRGDFACRADEPPPHVSTRLKVSLFWLGRQPMTMGRDYLLRIGTSKVKVRLDTITRLIDASTLDSSDALDAIGRNDVAECLLHCEQPIAFDLAAESAETGRFVIIDNYEICGGGIIQEAVRDEQSWVRDKVLVRNTKWEKSGILREQRAERYCQTAALVLVTGSYDSRKKDIAKALEMELFCQGRYVYYVGLGSLIYGVDADLKSMAPDSRTEYRKEHLRRFAEVAHLFLDSGTIMVSTAVDLTADDIELMQTIIQNYPLRVVWAGDDITTDIQTDLRIHDSDPLEKAVARIKSILQGDGVLFKGWTS